MSVSPVQVYDGLSMDDPLIGKFCDGVPHPAMLAASNVVLVQFATDFSVTPRGFNLTYEQRDGERPWKTADPLTVQGPENGLLSSPRIPSGTCITRDIRCESASV